MRSPISLNSSIWDVTIPFWSSNPLVLCWFGKVIIHFLTQSNGNMKITFPTCIRSDTDRTRWKLELVNGWKLHHIKLFTYLLHKINRRYTCLRCRSKNRTVAVSKPIYITSRLVPTYVELFRCQFGKKKKIIVHFI